MAIGVWGLGGGDDVASPARLLQYLGRPYILWRRRFAVGRR